MEGMLSKVKEYLAKFSDTDKDKKRSVDILRAMRLIDRRHFMMEPEFAYVDEAIRIEEGQTISQPSTVARMLQLARLDKGLSVLDVGCGSGYNAALISVLVDPGRVLSVDRIPSLVAQAKRNIEKLNEHGIAVDNLEIKVANFLSHDFNEQFDRVIITAGIEQKDKEKIRNLALRLLNNEGRLICPSRSGPIMIIKKKGSELMESETGDEYTFVPLLDE